MTSYDRIPLSEKAKGKQRAEPLVSNGMLPTGPSAIGSSTHAYTPDFTFKIRFSDGSADVTIVLPATERASTLKDQIRLVRRDLGRRRLRLIHNGTRLASTMPLSVLNNKRITTASSGEDGSDIPAITSMWVHCAIGDELEPGEEDNEAVSEQPTNDQNGPRGFDDFSNFGITQGEIDTYRRAFHSVLFGSHSSNQQASTLTEEESRTLEERWLASFSQGSTFEPPPTYRPQQSETRSLAQGLFFGILHPIFSRFILDPIRPPLFFDEDVFPEFKDAAPVEMVRKEVCDGSMRRAVFVGFVLNLFFGLVLLLD